LDSSLSVLSTSPDYPGIGAGKTNVCLQ
jgi:hypothetical protein